ncbi:hypothetical protein WICPIJ_002237 [Wickerhamomyces pijperi]|uniref:Uncharacterized protein n=1 Tax=Wickerhamomyces pijperi TaxID=599730 RepID=A0A9P8QA12_WICPI|nr:hypothetical protein WICPIJ_002237 [Wickerhamomyces pijperi]
MIVLIAVELFDVFSIPFYFLNLWIKTLISSVSLFASIGTGLRLIDSLIFTNYNTEETAQLLRGSYTMEVFFLCFVASLGIKALAIGFDLQFMNVDYLQNGSTSGAAAANDGESLIDSLNGDGINLQNFRDHTVRFKTTRQYDDSEDQRYVSLKQSNATLVDQHNPINLNIKPSMTSVGPLSNITISTPQILANSTFCMQRLPIIAQPIQQGLPSNGSMSSLRTNSGHQHQRDSVRSVNNTIIGTPTLDKFMKKKTTNEDRKYGIERAAINRIPSELLPPHLKTVVSATNQSNQGLGMHSYSHSNIVSQYQQTSPIHSSAPSGNDNSNMMIMSDIPRAQSSFQLGSSNGGANVNVNHAALRKLATQDWLRQPAPFKSSTATSPCSFFPSAASSVSPSPNDQTHFMNNENSTAYPQESTLPPFSQPVFNFTGTATATDIPIKDDLTFSSEEDSDASALSINSADNDKAASRYLASARNSISGQGAEQLLSSADFLEDAIKDHGTSQLKSTDTDIDDTTGFSKARSHSPHKSLSFFKSSHSRQGSMNSSFTFGRTTSMSYSASAPGSPKRRGANASPSKKLSIKNLSLSNISFDVNNIATSAGGAQHPDNTEDDSHIPNLAYLHELQKSPSPTKHHHHLSQSSTNTVIINSRRKSIHGKHPSMGKINESLLQSKKESVINTAAAATAATATTANASSNKSKNQSPNSKRSSNGSTLSNGSLFPEEVIGEYDREKWRALQRLNMVENEN